MEKYNQLLEMVKGLESDFQKFYVKEQAAAGTRLRKGLSDLRKFAQELRGEIQDTKNSRKAPKE